MCRIPSRKFPPIPLPTIYGYTSQARPIYVSFPKKKKTSSMYTNLPTLQSTTQASSSDPRQNQGIHNQDHPKVYIAWDKHPAYHTRNTGFNDPISQSTSNAFRSQDWWHFVDRSTKMKFSFPSLFMKKKWKRIMSKGLMCTQAIIFAQMDRRLRA